MIPRKNNSAILTKYYNIYKKNPRSLAFAPLAESYRKLGMLDEAYKVLREGIKFHPQYVLGFIVLAHCYYDQEKYELTYNTLRPIVAQNSDNISLQKLFALSCIHLGHLEEALETFKYLLFMNPRDKFFASQVKKLEDDLEVGHKSFVLDQIVSQKIHDDHFDINDRMEFDEGKKTENKQAKEIESNEEEWIQVNFSAKKNSVHDVVDDQGQQVQPKNLQESHEEDLSDQWHMSQGFSPIQPIKKELLESSPSNKNENTQKTKEVEDKLESVGVRAKSLEDEFFADEFADEGDIDEMNESLNSQELDDGPAFISHTLIDLYCSQKYYDKALELLDKIIETNPHDQLSKDKRDHVEQLKTAYHEEHNVEDQEEELEEKQNISDLDGGQDDDQWEQLNEEQESLEIISLIEKNKNMEKMKKIEKAFHHFLGLINDRSSLFRS